MLTRPTKYADALARSNVETNVVQSQIGSCAISDRDIFKGDACVLGPGSWHAGQLVLDLVLPFFLVRNLFGIPMKPLHAIHLHFQFYHTQQQQAHVRGQGGSSAQSKPRMGAGYDAECVEAAA